jgi:hypothetical protein
VAVANGSPPDRKESTMSRIRNTIVALAAAAVIIPAGGAGAESADALEQLRIICTMKTGDFFVTPYQLARCQDVRSNKGFASERALCTELGGSFNVSSEFSRNNRATWGCVAASNGG